MTRPEHSRTSNKTMLTARVLGYGGALPFLGGAIAASQQMVILGFPPAYLLLSYGAVILSFLGGLHWGRIITSPYADGRSDSAWLIWSVCPSLLGWAALLLPEKVAAVMLSLCFLAALQIDQRLIREKIWPAWMRPLRLHLSLIAVTSLTSLTIS
tara:strand:+ start:294 stop:758 length:465 start_codon:yes stop_codon:yes gene_type:complete